MSESVFRRASNKPRKIISGACSANAASDLVGADGGSTIFLLFFSSKKENVNERTKWIFWKTDREQMWRQRNFRHAMINSHPTTVRLICELSRCNVARQTKCSFTYVTFSSSHTHVFECTSVGTTREKVDLSGTCTISRSLFIVSCLPLFLTIILSFAAEKGKVTCSLGR